MSDDEFCRECGTDLAATNKLINGLMANIASLFAKLEAERDALRLILPMAKGYAHAHPVGSNAAYIAQAERVFAQGTEGESPVAEGDAP